MPGSALCQLPFDLTTVRQAGDPRRFQFPAIRKSQLNQNEEVGVHSSAIVATGMGDSAERVSGDKRSFDRGRFCIECGGLRDVIPESQSKNL
jgi:hypothetical protein